MAFFKLRKGGDDTAATARQPESVEAMRRRARHRLIGAGVLVLLGVIGFPLLFDTQPRPIAVDIPIEIPDRNKARPPAAPVAAPATPAVQAPAVSGTVTSSPTAASAAKVEAPPPMAARVEVPPVEARAEPKAEARADKQEPRTETKSAAARPESKPADGDRALALLEGKAGSKPAVSAEGRFIVQVGAFADATKARETRLKVERAGMKTYTHEAETREGKRIRVRVGPFASRADAEKAAEKIKGLDLQAAILTL